MLTTILIPLSALLLLHSGYSAHEHALTHLTASLPLDIVAETLLATLLLCGSIVVAMAGGENLRPIALRTWAGKMEREKGCGPFAALEDRGGFWDVRKVRGMVGGK